MFHARIHRLQLKVKGKVRELELWADVFRLKNSGKIIFEYSLMLTILQWATKRYVLLR